MAIHHSMWNPCGIHNHSMWNLYGIHMESKWNGIRKMSGIPAKTYSIWNGWNPPGITWNPHGIHMESIWNPYGIWGQGKDLLLATYLFNKPAILEAVSLLSGPW